MLRIIETEDGSHTLFSEEYGSAYHSRHGAVQESMHVFIEHGLRFVTQQKTEISILEMGFGTGLNAWLTLLQAAEHSLQIRYTTIERHPLPLALAQQFNYPTLSQHAPERFLELHRSDWGEWQTLSPHFQLKKIAADFEDWQPAEQHDLVYFDAFDPGTQPDLWNEAMMQKMATALRPGGILVTFCAKGSLKRALKAAGFTIERLPGPPGKREMTRGRMNG